ncbi:MAG: hypothetical protein D6748_08615 [Calditrichaeota bacterium]|nr:MAG: hypothetical protein D6748_08615 [Calditrichota bacterium]
MISLLQRRKKSFFDKFFSFQCLFIAHILFFLFCLLADVSGQTNVAQASIKVIEDSIYQEIVGWEAVAWIGQDDHLQNYKLWQDEVLDKAAFELGINRLRVSVFSGYENPVDYFDSYLKGEITYQEWEKHRFEIINDDIDPYHINPEGFQFSRLDFWMESVVLPMKKRLEKKGEKLFINLCYVDFGVSDFEHKTSALDYGEFVLATYLHLKEKYGIEPDAWEVILEPDMPAANWSPLQIVDAIRIAANRLEEHGFTPRFIAPSCTSVKNAISYFDKMVVFPDFRKYLFEFSYHLYRYPTKENRIAIGKRAKRYHIRTAQLEKIAATYHDLHDDLKLAQVSSWQQFTLCHPTEDNGAQYYWIDLNSSSQPKVNTGLRTHYLRLYFHYIHRGAHRIGAVTNNPDFDPLAFKNPDGSLVVVIRCFTPGKLSLEHLPEGTYGIVYCGHKRYNVSLPDFYLQAGTALETSVPRSGVITIYQKK